MVGKEEEKEKRSTGELEEARKGREKKKGEVQRRLQGR